MAIISWSIFLILGAISLLHLYWAFGGFWPGHDASSLANTVVGTKNMTTMPSTGVTIFVAACIFAAALLPLMWSAQIPYIIPQGLVWAGMWIVLFVFVSRGILGLSPFFNELSPMQPFASLNRKYYSPLCLLLGAGFASLIYLSGV